jgi:hypothetical protein
MEKEINEPKKSSSTRIILYGVTVLFLVVLTWFGIVLKDKLTKPQKVHFHAGFIVVKDNKKVDFSDGIYMNFRPCTNNDTEEVLTPALLQLEKAHLHDNIPDVVHSHIVGAKWRDLFTNIKYSVDYTNMTAFINGKKVNDFQNKEIKPYDSLVLFIGQNNDTNSFLSQAVTKEHIQQIEKKSESCGS